MKRPISTGLLAIAVVSIASAFASDASAASWRRLKSRIILSPGSAVSLNPQPLPPRTWRALRLPRLIVR